MGMEPRANTGRGAHAAPACLFWGVIVLKRFSANYMAALFLMDGALFQVALWLSVVLWHDWPELYAGLRLWIAIFWCVSFLLLDVYHPGKVIRWHQEYQRVFLGHLVASLMLAGTLFLLDSPLPRPVFLGHYLISALLLYGCRSLIRAWYRYRRWRDKDPGSINRVLVINGGNLGVNFVREFQNVRWPGIEITGLLDDGRDGETPQLAGLPILGQVRQAREIVGQYRINEVVIALPRGEHRLIAILVAELADLPVRVHVVPDYFDLAFFHFTVESLGGIPVIGLQAPAINGFQRMVKRIVDLILASLMIVLCLPLVLLVAIAIKLEDRGPVFYWTERIGENQRLFRMLKLRSMVEDASIRQEEVNQYDDAGNLIHKRRDDPRVTQVGHWIRRHSIDELPNLWNVLTGEMSLVGPRPELPWMVARYEPWQMKRFAVPQGMTGWWQVTGRSDKPMHLHTDDDIYYIQHYSLWLDIQIMWRTIAVVLRGKGAY